MHITVAEIVNGEHSDSVVTVDVSESIRATARNIHLLNQKWWFNPDGTKKSRNVYEMLMLTVSELAEAMTGFRKNIQDDHLPNRLMIEVELADTIVRCLDLGEAMGLDVAGAMIEKLKYNQKRNDHKKEAAQMRPPDVETVWEMRTFTDDVQI